MRILAQHPNFEVVCRDNVPTEPLRRASEKYGVHYCANEKERGFATNNNLNFKYCRDKLGMKEDDYFILLNPDIYMLNAQVEELVRVLASKEHKVYVPNLQLDKEGFMQDDNIRMYPKFTNFLQTFLLNKRVTMVDRNEGLEDTSNLWASGAFMVIKAGLYQKIKGLDEQFYLYCEDIDFCARLKQHGVNFHYLPNIKPVHLRRRQSKKILSKHFYWHVGSVIRHSFIPKKIQARRSLLNDSAKVKRVTGRTQHKARATH
ncbi:glycosyltransferase [Vibrio sp. qd031]|uniref:glycosyltransferase n=1 Tax=Vibrio sp. qd031 TaxID=1603038 RepID=UPI00117CAB86|nr:glycosyltransferase [Vibrio sp. qd031]